MMKKTVAILVGLLSFSFFQVALARSGIYIVSESGWATQSGLPTANDIQANRVEQSHAPILRLGLGYLHDFNDTFGLGFEAAGGWYRGSTYYLSSGKKVDTYSTTTEFMAVFVLHEQALDYFVKFGGIRHTLNNFSVMSGDSDASETKIQPEATVGLNYNFNEHFALTAEYLHSFGASTTSFVANGLKCPSINAALAGIRIAFW
jgi:opacity protein-like surface antigen